MGKPQWKKPLHEIGVTNKAKVNVYDTLADQFWNDAQMDKLDQLINETTAVSLCMLLCGNHVTILQLP